MADKPLFGDKTLVAVVEVAEAVERIEKAIARLERKVDKILKQAPETEE